MELITKRLILRPLRNSDAESLRENINNLDVAKWLLMVPHPYTLRDAKNWIRDSTKNWKKKEKDYNFGIELRAEGKIIGGIGLQSINKTQGTGTLGYWIGKLYWGNGYGTEALQAVVDFAFNRLKLRRLEAEVFVGNLSSEKLLEKIGFRLEGTKRQAKKSKADGKVHDEQRYGLLKEDYKAR